LTGYRPITETEGLDFDPEWFNEVGRTKDETGLHCPYVQGTK